MFVMVLVKSVIFPTTLLEKFCTPVAMEAANSAPGKWGIAGPDLPVVGVVATGVAAGPEAVLPNVGS
jgi:hypothetical protein